jgi:acyl-coenzyme A thioesterase PaaI-like protein
MSITESLSLENLTENTFVNLSEWAEENNLTLLIDYINNTENMYRRLGLSKKSFSFDPENKVMKIEVDLKKDFHNGLHLDLETGKEIDLAHGGFLSFVIDACSGALFFTKIEQGELPKTTNLTINYLAPAIIGLSIIIKSEFETVSEDGKTAKIKTYIFQDVKRGKILCSEGVITLKAVKAKVVGRVVSKML